MLFSPAHRAGAAVLAVLVLAGCSLREAGPDPGVRLPPLASGGGMISSDQGAASAPDTPPEPGPPESREETQEDAPSFQELPSSQPPSSQPPSSQAPESPSSGSSAVSPPPSGSSQPPPPSSSSVPSSVAEEPEEDEEEEEPDEEDEEEEEEPVHSRPSRPSSGKPPEPESSGDDDVEDSASGWQELRVQSGGSTVSGSGVSIVARIVQNEIGSTYPDEAIKAQAVAAYTFVRYHNSTGSAPAVGLANSANERVTRLVKEVAGEQITYDSKPILASYCAMSAGQTASSRSVWGRDLAYLRPVDSSVDEAESGFLRTMTLSSGQVKSKLQSALGVNLDGVDPEDWFEILSWWDDGPYVNEVRIGGTVTTTGRKLRENIFGLRSAAFEIGYDPGADRFTFTTRGYGHGVGMSQVGAKHLANDGWDHTEILEHYYSGAQAG